MRKVSLAMAQCVQSWDGRCERKGEKLGEPRVWGELRIWGRVIEPSRAPGTGEPWESCTVPEGQRQSRQCWPSKIWMAHPRLTHKCCSGTALLCSQPCPLAQSSSVSMNACFSCPAQLFFSPAASQPVMLGLMWASSVQSPAARPVLTPSLRCTPQHTAQLLAHSVS